VGTGLRGRLAELRAAVRKARGKVHLAASTTPVPAGRQGAEGSWAQVWQLSDGEVCQALQQLVFPADSVQLRHAQVGAQAFALVLALPPPVQPQEDDHDEPLHVLALCVRVVEECRRQRAALLQHERAALSPSNAAGEQAAILAGIARLDLLRAAVQTVISPDAPGARGGRKGKLKRLGMSSVVCRLSPVRCLAAVALALHGRRCRCLCLLALLPVGSCALSRVCTLAYTIAY